MLLNRQIVAATEPYMHIYSSMVAAENETDISSVMKRLFLTIVLQNWTV